MEQTEEVAQGVFVRQCDTEVRPVECLELCDIIGSRRGQLHGLQPGTKPIAAHLPLRAGNRGDEPSSRTMHYRDLSCSDPSTEFTTETKEIVKR